MDLGLSDLGLSPVVPSTSTPPQTGVPGLQETSPRRLLRRFGLLSLASVTAILLLVGGGLYQVYRAQLI